MVSLSTQLGLFAALLNPLVYLQNSVEVQLQLEIGCRNCGDIELTSRKNSPLFKAKRRKHFHENDPCRLQGIETRFRALDLSRLLIEERMSSKVGVVQ